MKHRDSKERNVDGRNEDRVQPKDRRAVEAKDAGVRRRRRRSCRKYGVKECKSIKETKWKWK